MQPYLQLTDKYFFLFHNPLNKFSGFFLCIIFANCVNCKAIVKRFPGENNKCLQPVFQSGRIKNNYETRNRIHFHRAGERAPGA